ncbi:hypothetical protein AAC387_Pa06g0862 [Persea americana]
MPQGESRMYDFRCSQLYTPFGLENELCSLNAELVFEQSRRPRLSRTFFHCHNSLDLESTRVRSVDPPVET